MAEKKEYIDRNAFLRSLPTYYGRISGKTLAVEVIKLLSDFPTADAVEVVRCENCRFSYTNPCNERISCQRRYPRMPMEEGDFCSYGEKAEESHG